MIEILIMAIVVSAIFLENNKVYPQFLHNIYKFSYMNVFIKHKWKVKINYEKLVLKIACVIILTIKSIA